jgi:hypothetical protein
MDFIYKKNKNDNFLKKISDQKKKKIKKIKKLPIKPHQKRSKSPQ